MESHKYFLKKLVEIRFADPISAIKVSESYLIFGSMMGRITLFPLDIENAKPIPLCDMNTENISDIALQDDGKTFNVGMGDEFIEKYTVRTENGRPMYSLNKMNVYESENQHTQYCENAFVMMSPEAYFNIQLVQPEEGNQKLTDVHAQYILKNINGGKKDIKKELLIRNYTIPFDFDGERFVYVQFLSSEEREICIVNLLKKDISPVKFRISKDFGHISYIRFMQESKLFLVRKLNQCEIRSIDHINNDLPLIQSFEHIGDEVYACDIYYESKIETTPPDVNDEDPKNVSIEMKKQEHNEYLMNNKVINVHVSKKNTEERLTLKEKNEIQDDMHKSKNMGELNSNGQQISTLNCNYNTLIYTLDIDGNVNMFDLEKEKTLFNLYDIDEIDQDQKDKQFFSMGYAYFIRVNLNHICITSDHGCYVIYALRNE